VKRVKKIIRVGSRDSVLAVRQTRLVMEALARAYPKLRIELVTMKTAGDLNLRPFDQLAQGEDGIETKRLGAKGLFVKELERALLDEKIDVAVHSLKDMSAEQNERLPICAFFERGDPRDALVSPLGRESDERGDIGCSSARRRVQLARLLPGSVRPIRGNVLTRLKKLDEGQYAFLVLAAAGLRRLGLESRISRVFAPEEMIPAAGQGSLACQAREGDCDFIEAVNDPDTESCSRAERAFVARLGGGCTLPVGVYARVRGTEMSLIGFYVDESQDIYRVGSLSGNRKDAVKLGETLASRLQRGEVFER
jgi:hydroxymethylbilane synthase